LSDTKPPKILTVPSKGLLSALDLLDQELSVSNTTVQRISSLAFVAVHMSSQSAEDSAAWVTYTGFCLFYCSWYIVVFAG